MADIKTTLTGVITGILAMLAYYGIVIPEVWTGVILGIGVALLGYFSKDKPPTP